MTRNAELERFKAELENTWRIASDLGDPVSEDMRAFELVSLEMKFRADFPLAMFAANAVQQWIVTRNPFHIDRAVVACAEAGVEPCPALFRQISEVAKRRLNGDVGAGTADKLAVETAKQATLMFIANLIHAGETLEAACSKAANWHQAKYPNLKRLKASTLDRYYAKEWRKVIEGKSTQEQHMFGQWDRHKDGATKGAWKEIAANIPIAQSDLKGERR